MSVTVQPVRNSSQQNDFFSLRRTLYANDPQVVFPLQSMDRQLLDPQIHPFYEHAQREWWVAYRNGQPVGRIVAIKNDLQQSHDQNQLGFFGFFECIDDQGIADSLIDAACQWLKEQGCDTIRGPVNPSMKGEFGVLIDGHETSPTIMTMHNHARYKRLLEANGCGVIREFYAFQFFASTSASEAVRSKWDKLFSSRDRILKRFPQLSFRAVNAKTFDHSMREINELSNRVRSAGWGFVPLTPAELTFMIKNLRRVIRYDMIQVAYWNDTMVGYIVNIPDVNWALKRTWGRQDWLRMIQMPFLIPRSPRCRVIALGVDEDYRTKGIAMLLMARLIERYNAFAEWEFSWVDSENMKSIRAIERTMPLVKTKTYQLFERAL
ncbi:MAG: GNAT family N-acetyltransferase [Planctomycetota bacterium]